MKRTLFFITLLFIARSVSADTIALTGGYLNYYNGEPGGASLLAPNFSVGATTFGAGPKGITTGSTVDWSGVYSFGGCGSAIINGTNYQSSPDFNSGGCGRQVWITTNLLVTATPFIAPDYADPRGFFRTPFTISGTITGSANAGGPILFSTDISGSGDAAAGYKTIQPDLNSSLYLTDGPSFTLSQPVVPSPNPEPATLILFGTAIFFVAVIWRYRRKTL